jgi:hypothetical protein
MPLRPCLDCGHLTTGGSTHEGARCPGCARTRAQDRDHHRGTARQRGYDTRHDRLRTRLLPLAYNTPCPRCGEPMLVGQALDLGHSTARAVDPHARGDRIEHARCNRSFGIA